jgi:hypothetical protein
MNLKYTCNDSQILSSILSQGFMCNQDIVPERTKNAFLEGAIAVNWFEGAQKIREK